MKLLYFLLLGAVAGIDHLVSFNVKCDATFNILAGTPAQGAMAANHIPFQFIRSLQRVLQARVSAVSGCGGFATVDTQWPPKSVYSQLFGMDIINVLRLLDASDTTIDSASFGTCNQNYFAFNWKTIRANFPGLKMPSTCTAANFFTNDCRFTFELIKGLNVTAWIADKCSDSNQPGYRLPQLEFRCTGSLCATFGKPCTSDNDCASPTRCDATPLQLNNATQALEDMGLYSSTYDSASCPSVKDGFTFAEQFFSKVINNVANLVGYTSTVDTSKQWTTLSMCGFSEFNKKFSSAPTPVPMFVCSNGTQFPTYIACNGINECPGGEDEQNCGCGYGGGWVMGDNGYCCHVCDTDNNCHGPSSAGGPYCSIQNSGGIEICTSDPQTGVLDCSQYLGSTTGATGNVVYPTLQSVSNPKDGAVVGWADCSGNVQIGNTAAIGVANFLTPYHEIAKRAESVLLATQGCRVGSDTSPEFLRRHFYPWGITWIGSIFLDDLYKTTSYNGQTPGANLDRGARWYHSAEQQNCTYNCPQNCTFGCVCSEDCTYIVPPPFANLQNAWSTCNLASITGSQHSCQINAAIQSWFKGAGFPVSWGQVAATLAISVESNCAGDVLPQAYITCNGPCAAGSLPANGDSGCCLMNRPLIVLAPGATCPTGYTQQSVTSDVTDFVFNHSAYTTGTTDTTLINFLQLLAAHAVDFSSNPAFVSPASGPQFICVIDGHNFGNNTGEWGSQVYTENCPVPYTAATSNGKQGCPQILSGGPVSACGTGAGQTACVDPPKGTTCPATGCPNGNPTNGCPAGTVCSGGFWVAPALFALLLPMVI